jgi:thiamine-monophosphate kinase
MNEQNKRTELGKLGEFGLIEKIKADFIPKLNSTKVGIGDDAAVVDSGDHYTVITTDMLVEGVHFDLSYMPLHHLGYKAVAVNISDIAAMNAEPQYITVSIGISNRFSLQAVEALYKGIGHACENYNIDLIGGDTTSSRSGLIISVTAVGKVDKDKVALRSTAKKNDIICVTGDLGAAYVGLQILEREKQVFLSNPDMQPNLEAYDYIVRRQLKPEARMDFIFELKDLGVVPTSMMDISDGLASELLHICKASECGVHIFEDKLPIQKMSFETAAELQLNPITCAMNGGEDYELLFTISQSDFEILKNNADVSMIGYITDASEGAKLITTSGTVAEIKAQGWTHF